MYFDVVHIIELGPPINKAYHMAVVYPERRTVNATYVGHVKPNTCVPIIGRMPTHADLAQAA